MTEFILIPIFVIHAAAFFWLFYKHHRLRDVLFFSAFLLLVTSHILAAAHVDMPLDLGFYVLELRDLFRFSAFAILAVASMLFIKEKISKRTAKTQA